MRPVPAVFLDRDGVINVDSDAYVKSWDEFSFRPDALDSLRRLHEANVEVYIITNQAGIGRGLFSEAALRDILLRLRLEVRRAGGLIHGIEYCPHPPDAGCRCRKPEIGNLLKAASKYGLELQRSVFVGDSCGDINAAHAAGCTSILLTTRTEMPPSGSPQPVDADDQAPESLDSAQRDLIHARQTLAEGLRHRQPGACGFTPRQAFGNLIVDFYCHEDAVAILLDPTRSARLHDRARARHEYLRTLGLKVLRFTAREVLDGVEDVLEQIDDAVSGVLPLAKAGGDQDARHRDIRELNHASVLDHLDRCLLPPQYIVPSLGQAVETILRLPEFARLRRVRRAWG